MGVGEYGVVGDDELPPRRASDTIGFDHILFPSCDHSSASVEGNSQEQIWHLPISHCTYKTLIPIHKQGLHINKIQRK